MTYVKGKKRAQLTEGMPSKIKLVLDWGGACELSADRRNCIIHRALMRKEQITRPTVGTDKITFIWRGDARVEVVPPPHLLRAILQNDEAHAGFREWPTGEQVTYLPLDSVKVYDLRPGRERARANRTPEELARRNESRKKWAAQNPGRTEAAKRNYAERQKKANKSKVERGRFVLS